MKHGEIKQRILKKARANPSATSAEIARTIGADRSYVNVVLKEAGLTRPQSKTYHVKLGADNHAWVLDQCKTHNIKPEAFLNACITDARLDDEGLGGAAA